MAGPKKFKNETGKPLAFSLTGMLRDGLMQEAQFVDSKSEYSKYANECRRFGEQVLKESYTSDQVKVMESVRDYPITIAKTANAVGKTMCAARIAVHFYKSHLDAQVYTTAAPPEDNLRRILWGEIGSLVERNPHVFSEDAIKLNSMRIARSAKSFIVGVNIPATGTSAQREAKFSGKHAPYLLFIIDEGDAVPIEIYRGIESCMSGGHARLLIMFNPRNESGYVYQLEQQGLANVVELSAFTHPNVLTGKDIIPGAVTQEVTVRRTYNWTREMYPNEKEDSSCFDVPAGLVGKQAMLGNGQMSKPLRPGKRKIIEAPYAYMVLGKYPETSENQLMNRTWIDAAIERWEFFVKANGEFGPIGIMPMMGQDVAEFGGDLNVCTLRHDYFVRRQMVWSGVDPTVTADEASKIYIFNSCCGAWVDANGVGAAVPPLMRKKKCKAYRIMTAGAATQQIDLGEFGRIRDQGWWFFREWLRTTPQSMLPPCEILKEELLAMHYYKDGRNKIRVTSKDVIRDRLRRSPDRSDSIMLTFCPIPEDDAGNELRIFKYI